MALADLLKNKRENAGFLFCINLHLHVFLHHVQLLSDTGKEGIQLSFIGKIRVSPRIAYSMSLNQMVLPDR
jgi:hypothetical protein